MNTTQHKRTTKRPQMLILEYLKLFLFSSFWQGVKARQHAQWAVRPAHNPRETEQISSTVMCVKHSKVILYNGQAKMRYESPHLKINFKRGAPGWLSRLGVWLRLRSWSHSSWVRAPSRALCWQLRAWSLLQILCLPLSLPLPCSCSVSLCPKNK